MNIYSIISRQVLPLTAKQAWDFFSCPGNLPDICPPYLDFKIKSGYNGERMYAGQIIEYTLKPFRGIKINWVSEITHVNEPWFFVDEQRFGPYALWHHKHYFREVESGVEMTDIVHYAIPGWILGIILHKLMIRKQLEKIFSFREKKLEQKFGQHANMLTY